MNERYPRRGNVFGSLPSKRDTEHFDTLVALGGGTVRRIVSFGQSSPEGYWYDQEENEWVLVLRGHARLEVEGYDEPVELAPGDFIDLAAHTRHRVAWTTPDEPTIWLAIHYRR